MTDDTDLMQSDLRELLLILGMGDYARPQSPHEVFQGALRVLRLRLGPKPFNMDLRAQAAVLSDLPPSVAQEAGEFYENADAGRPKGTILKREAMAVAWRGVLRPYFIGLRDHSGTQARPLDREPLSPA